eukprot:9329252-Prorocentrum_lima.AAC.1
MGLRLVSTDPSESTSGTHVSGDSVRRIDYLLLSSSLMKVWRGWSVAHQLAVLPDAHNYHLPLMG